MLSRCNYGLLCGALAYLRFCGLTKRTLLQLLQLCTSAYDLFRLDHEKHYKAGVAEALRRTLPEDTIILNIGRCPVAQYQ